MELGLEAIQVHDRSYAEGWHPEDYLPTSTDPISLADPWSPPIEQATTISAQPHKSSTAALLDAPDPWCAGGSKESPLLSFVEETDHWSESVDLPRYDPHAVRHPWTLDHLDKPFARDAASKATWIVASFQLATASNRTKWLRAFEIIFLDRTDDRFFKKILDLTSSSEAPENLVAAVELRSLWNDRADFRQIRVSTNRRTAYTQGPNLSWQGALQIATARSDFDLNDMVEDDWLDDWRRLKPGSSGYWSFAEYACLRANSERFEDWDFPAALFREDSLWEKTRYTPADDCSGTKVSIRQTHPTGSAELARRFQEWREKQHHLLQEPELKAPAAEIVHEPISATPPGAPAPSSMPVCISRNEEFETLFASLKNEMQATLHLTHRDRS